MLTLAARLGEPSAVFLGPADAFGEVADAVKRYGAGTVHAIDDAHLIAQRLRADILPKVKPGMRIFADLSITDAKDDMTLHRDDRFARKKVVDERDMLISKSATIHRREKPHV